MEPWSQKCFYFPVSLRHPVYLEASLILTLVQGRLLASRFESFISLEVDLDPESDWKLERKKKMLSRESNKSCLFWVRRTKLKAQ
jgi:hypothetical protein